MKLAMIAFFVVSAFANAVSLPANSIQNRAPTVTKWDKAVNDGRQLYNAMRSKDSIARWFYKDYPDFADTVQSPFDGDLREELRKWGYNDNDALSKLIEKDCDFDAYHHIKPAFDELGLDTRAMKDGGPNVGFRVDHQDGPAIKRKGDGTLPSDANQYYDVCGKEYRATTGTFEFIVNPGGMIALMNVRAPSYSAGVEWGRKPTTAELPHLRAISDIAWGMWNRAGPSNKDVKYLIVTQILNPTTRELIARAYKTLDPPQGQDKVWPGVEFSMETEAGQAMLGSPVGRWAGYFLMQHKTQLGGNRFISKVRVFKNEESGSLAYLCFYVDPTPAPDGAMAALPPRELAAAVKADIEAFSDSARLARMGGGGKAIVREHVLRW
ncbi:hypothetical protein IAQ61_000390 [Plenodomus lingam]|uniref:START domain-containing protein n=1 Tax=Leptosphaeria maculans (strain JN3 / isolate v23.1.3 / race Av1-4-5-6-7-8) TaxID=985895 RepID=E5R4T8_LEPMJ|nr:hypothetical protein LEMA_P049170.1 [Plenodomus lingam JN3]KAH9881663.1 hypothetical protein IAQ61_000390 [Plenodomus lingam]CBX92211.1 hypothetical protein LEMA_P049170.1 [Plenodomus lingam JN3]